MNPSHDVQNEADLLSKYTHIHPKKSLSYAVCVAKNLANSVMVAIIASLFGSRNIRLKSLVRPTHLV